MKKKKIIYLSLISSLAATLVCTDIGAQASNRNIDLRIEEIVIESKRTNSSLIDRTDNLIVKTKIKNYGDPIAEDDTVIVESYMPGYSWTSDYCVSYAEHCKYKSLNESNIALEGGVATELTDSGEVTIDKSNPQSYLPLGNRTLMFNIRLIDSSGQETVPTYALKSSPSFTVQALLNTSLPDLEMDSSYVYSEESYGYNLSDIQKGDNLKVSAYVKNTGFQSVNAPFQISAELEGVTNTKITKTFSAEDLPLSVDRKKSINIGSIALENLPAPPSGEHKVIFTVDSANTLNEVSEDNNQFEKTINIDESRSHYSDIEVIDLKFQDSQHIDYSNPQFDPQHETNILYEGNTVELFAVIKNNGPDIINLGPSTYILVAGYQDYNNETPIISYVGQGEYGHFDNITLQPGQEKIVMVNSSLSTRVYGFEPGKINFDVSFHGRDFDNGAIYENSYSNNLRAFELNATDQFKDLEFPEIKVTSQSSNSEHEINKTDSLTVSANIRNPGKLDTGSFKARAFIKVNNSEQFAIEKTISNVPGETAENWIEIGTMNPNNSTLPSGSQEIFVRLDSLNQVSESRENNNEDYKEIYIRDYSSVVHTGNAKNRSAYSPREVFVVSDAIWQNVISLVPLTTWTAQTSEEYQWCKDNGYVPHQGAPNVCAFPIHIHHEETSGVDLDSAVLFNDQYQTEKISYYGQIRAFLHDKDKFQQRHNFNFDDGSSYESRYPRSINEELNEITSTSYLDYWSNYQDIVLVQNNYEKALLATTYASLINAPLVIQGSDLYKNNPEIFQSKNIICAGYVHPPSGSSASCNESQRMVSVHNIQERYIQEANSIPGNRTDKLIITNPNDVFNVSYQEEEYETDLFEDNKISNLFSKDSLVAPILASAKHEVIVPIASKEIEKVDQELEKWVTEHPEFQEHYFQYTEHDYICQDQSAPSAVKYINLSTLEEDKLTLDCGSNNGVSRIEDGKIYFDTFRFGFKYGYDIENNEHLDLQLQHSDDLRKNHEIYSADELEIHKNHIIFINREEIDGVLKNVLYHYNIATKKLNKVLETERYTSELKMDFNGEYVVWTLDENIYHYNVYTEAQASLGYDISSYGNGSSIRHLAASQNYIYFTFNNDYGVRLVVYDTENKSFLNKERFNSIGIIDPSIDHHSIVFNRSDYDGGLFLYDLLTDQYSKITSDYDLIREIHIREDNVVWKKSNFSAQQDSIHRCKISQTGSQYGCGENDEKEIIYTSSLYDIQDLNVSANYISLPSEDENAKVRYGGYLTIVGSPFAIEHDRFMHPKYQVAADRHFYADFDGNLQSDINVGRISGLTVTDSSTNVARSLFFDKLPLSNSAMFDTDNSGFGDEYIDKVTSWSSIFNGSNDFNAQHLSFTTDPIYSYHDPGELVNFFQEYTPSLYNYLGHAYERERYENYPDTFFSNIFYVDGGCNVCDLDNFIRGNGLPIYRSQCYQVIRSGAVAFLGAVSDTPTGNDRYTQVVNGSFYYNYSLGESSAYLNAGNGYYTQLLGDPTLVVSPSKKISQPLEYTNPYSRRSIKDKSDPNQDIDADGVKDKDDNCPEVYNPYQDDLDMNNIGDVCEEDKDGDGILAATDCNDNDDTLNERIFCSFNGSSCGNYTICASECPASPSQDLEICGDGIDQDCDGSDLACEDPGQSEPDPGPELEEKESESTPLKTTNETPELMNIKTIE